MATKIVAMAWTKKQQAESMERYRQRNKDNPEYQQRKKEHQKRYYETHKDKFRKQSREGARRYRQRHPDRMTIIRENSRAKNDYGLTTKITEDEWKAIKYKSPICPRCKKDVGCENLEMDHIIPMKDGGKHTIDNIQALCRTCNARKNPWRKR